MAYESLAVISNALSRLNCGQLGVCRFVLKFYCSVMIFLFFVRFGVHVEMLHCLEKPFSASSGGFILQHLTFDQTRTNFAEVLYESTPSV